MTSRSIIAFVFLAILLAVGGCGLALYADGAIINARSAGRADAVSAGLRAAMTLPPICELRRDNA